jgi:hypothetical protein
LIARPKGPEDSTMGGIDRQILQRERLKMKLKEEKMRPEEREGYYVCVYEFVCIYICKYIYVWIQTYAHTYLYIHLYLCINKYS